MLGWAARQPRTGYRAQLRAFLMGRDPPPASVSSLVGAIYAHHSDWVDATLKFLRKQGLTLPPPQTYASTLVSEADPRSSAKRGAGKSNSAPAKRARWEFQLSARQAWEERGVSGARHHVQPLRMGRSHARRVLLPPPTHQRQRCSAHRHQPLGFGRPLSPNHPLVLNG